MLLDLSEQPAGPDRFKLIVTAMTMHHVKNVELVISRLGQMLTDDGWLAIADLCQDDGSFHDDIPTEHNGFDPDAMAQTVTQAIPGTSCQWQIAHTIDKNDRRYDVFLLTANRKAKQEPAC